MNLNDFKKSRYLKKEDVGAGILVSISRVVEENVAMEGAEPDHRPVIYFNELDKGMVCNSTNAQLIAQVAGAQDEIEVKWPGTKIVLYNDPNIMFAGKLTGGIRVRAPRDSKDVIPF